MGSRLNGFLLDTHIWLWHLTTSARLPKGLRTLIDRAAERCWLSPISVWELGLLVDRGQVQLDAPLRAWVGDAFARLPLREATMTMDVALRAHEIDLAARDAGDRVLAATALELDLRLLTVDPNLTAAVWLPTRSK